MRYLTTLLLGVVAVAPVLGAPRVVEPDPERRGPVIRISLDVIQLDVVVTDGKGRHITDLGPEDFEIRQDGSIQKVTHVSYVRAGEPWKDPVALASPRELDADPPADVPAPPRTLVLVYDDLGMSLESSVRARQAFQVIIDGLLPSDRVGIISTSNWDGSLHLTSEKQELHALTSELRHRPFSQEDVSIPANRTPFSYLGDGGHRLDGARLDWNQRLAIYSLVATRQVIEELKKEAGRKAVILVSQGFPGLTTLDNLYFGQLNWGVDAVYGRAGDVQEALRRIGDLAARASVVVHTIDPRGLVTTGQNAAAASQSPPVGHGFLADSRFVLGNGQASLEYLPRETGGLAIMDTNDLGRGAQTVLADMAGYYLIGYEPDEPTFEGERPEFHDVEIVVKRRGVKVRTRSGFYGVADEDL